MTLTLRWKIPFSEGRSTTHECSRSCRRSRGPLIRSGYTTLPNRMPPSSHGTSRNWRNILHFHLRILIFSLMMLRHFDIKFCNQIRCTGQYILELMFSGFQIEKDQEFRDRYSKVNLPYNLLFLTVGLQFFSYTRLCTTPPEMRT